MLFCHSLPTLLAEGMETSEFWSLLGGKTEYSHHSIKNEVRDCINKMHWKQIPFNIFPIDP